MSRIWVLGVSLSLLLFACANKERVQEQHNTELTFPIEEIRNRCIKRQLHYDVNSLNLSDYKPIDSIFFKRWFDRRSINFIKYEPIRFDKYSRYYFFDYKELDKLVLFSIIYNDEIGYTSIYHFTYDKAKNRIVQTDLIAETGGDGGESSWNILDYNQAGDRLKITSVSTYDEDYKQGYTHQYDSIISTVEFGNLRTKYKNISSVSRVDTIRENL
ncbi:MAG: hypothetical protein PHV20_06160 [Bacteroidales bacterium]|nr:hypothetical protein [Bacteroidales bacterium]